MNPEALRCVRADRYVRGDPNHGKVKRIEIMLTSQLRRRHVLTRALAFLLILLAASPLTTPFSTVDVGPVSSGTAGLDSPKTKSTTDDAIAAPFVRLGGLVHDFRFGLPAPAAGPHTTPDAQHVILRL